MIENPVNGRQRWLRGFAIILALLTSAQLVAIIVLGTMGCGQYNIAEPALFSPLRGWVQAVIDRRFYRQKYDAQQVLARFAQTAQEETDIGMLTAELVQVVQETIQPNQATLWLRPDRGSQASGGERPHG